MRSLYLDRQSRAKSAYPSHPKRHNITHIIVIIIIIFYFYFFIIIIIIIIIIYLRQRRM